MKIRIMIKSQRRFRPSSFPKFATFARAVYCQRVEKPTGDILARDSCQSLMLPDTAGEAPIQTRQRGIYGGSKPFSHRWTASYMSGTHR